MNFTTLNIFSDFAKTFTKVLITKQRYKIFMQGLSNSLVIALVACAIGLVIGLLVTIIKTSPLKDPISYFFKKLANLYVTLVRGTPVVLQLLIIYLVILKSISSVWDGLLVASITFGLNSGAYMSEILRAGLLGVPKGQMEAGRSLGFSWFRTMNKIIIPQGLKNSVPTAFNEFIMLVKETSVAGFVGIIDLTKASQDVTYATYDVFGPLLVAACCYLVIVLGLQQIQKYLERRFSVSD